LTFYYWCNHSKR